MNYSAAVIELAVCVLCRPTQTEQADHSRSSDHTGPSTHIIRHSLAISSQDLPKLAALIAFFLVQHVVKCAHDDTDIRNS